MGKLKTRAVVGAILQLGECFDLMDTRFTRDLATAYSAFKKVKALAKERFEVKGDILRTETPL